MGKLLLRPLVQTAGLGQTLRGHPIGSFPFLSQRKVVAAGMHYGPLKPADPGRLNRWRVAGVEMRKIPARRLVGVSESVLDRGADEGSRAVQPARRVVAGGGGKASFLAKAVERGQLLGELAPPVPGPECPVDLQEDRSAFLI